MKKNFLFVILAIFLVVFWFGGISIAEDIDCANVTTSGDFSVCIANWSEIITIWNDIDFGTNARYEISSPVTINWWNYTFTDKITETDSYSLLQFKPGSEWSKIENLNFEITT